MELTAVLVVPALAAGLVLTPALARGAALITLVASGLTLALSIRVAAGVVASGPATALAGLLSCDALSALVLLLIAFVGTTAALFSAGYLGARGHRDERREGRRYYSLYNLFLLSMLAVPIIAHIALMWIAVSLTTLLSAFLVGYEDTPEALEAAWKYVVLTTLGRDPGPARDPDPVLGQRHRRGRLVHLGGAGRGRAADAAGTALDRLPAGPGRIRDQGRAGAHAHLAARRPQPGAGLDLRAAVRGRDHDRAVRDPAAVSGARGRGAGAGAHLVRRVRADLGRGRGDAPDPRPGLQAHVRLLHGRAHGDHPGRGRARGRRRPSRCCLSDDRACPRQVVLLLCRRDRRDRGRDPGDRRRARAAAQLAGGSAGPPRGRPRDRRRAAVRGVRQRVRDLQGRARRRPVLDDRAARVLRGRRVLRHPPADRPDDLRHARAAGDSPPLPRRAAGRPCCSRRSR